MEFLDKNMISMILDRLRSNREVNKCSLINKWWYQTIKNYYYKNKLTYKFWKNHNPIYDHSIPCLRLSWHLTYRLFKQYQDARALVKDHQCHSCYELTGTFRMKYVCSGCGANVCYCCINLLHCCGRVVCSKCFENKECEECTEYTESSEY